MPVDRLLPSDEAHDLIDLVRDVGDRQGTNQIQRLVIGRSSAK